MAKEFAKSFYRSKAWQRCRDAYIQGRILEDGGLCEMCHDAPGVELHHKTFLSPQNINDPNVTLNHENLAWLCKDCHFKVHKDAILRGFQKKKDSKILTDGMYFDDSGNLAKQRVVIVWGPPASGKTTYIRDHMDVTDMVVDLDMIRQAVTMGEKEAVSNNLLSLSIMVREYLYQLIECRDSAVDCKTVWIAATLPRKKEREGLAKRLSADLIFMNRSIDECFSAAENDSNRKNMLFQHDIIEKWFEVFEP